MLTEMARRLQSLVRSAKTAGTPEQKRLANRATTALSCPIVEILEDRCVPAIVTNLLDAGAGSLRQAVVDTNGSADNTITFAAGLSGTITLTSGELAVTDDLNIIGPGNNVITVDANGASRVFNVNDGSATDRQVTISGLRLKGGSTATGGAIVNLEDLTLSENVIVRNTATLGGAIHHSVGTLTIQNTTISGNTAASGGGVYNDGGIVLVRNSSIAFNAASNGGGVVNTNGGALTIEDSLLLENDAVDPAGGGALSFGGGLLNIGSTATIRRSIFSQNLAGELPPDVPIPGTAGFGGAIANLAGSTLTIEQSTLDDNVAISITLADLTKVGGLGGGIFNSGAGSTFTVSGSTISTNQGRLGAGIHNDEDDPPVIINSTISGNVASQAGGGIFGLVDVFNSTIAFNSATESGGGMNTSGSILTSTIVCSNAATLGPDIFGDVTAISSLICNPHKTVFNPGSVNNLTNTDALLGPLAENGGLTKTHALSTGSPAIDAGINSESLATDQRAVGFVRTVDDATVTNGAGSDGTDIGAFEVGAVPVIPPGTGPTATLTSAPAVTATEFGLSQYQFTITMADDVAIRFSSLDNTDIRVTGPNGFSQLATLFSVDNPSNGTPRVVTYQITPPGGSWDEADNGTYTISIEANQVSDTDGNAVVAGALGTFTVTTAAPPAPPVLGATPIINGTSLDDVILIGPVAGQPNVVSVNINGIDLGTVEVPTSLLVNGLAGNDLIVVDAAVSVNALLRGDAGNDTLIGGGGDDTLVGGTGDDVYVWLSTASGDDQIIELANEGFDTIDLSAIAEDITFGFYSGFEVPSGTEGATFELAHIEQILSGSGNDVFIWGENARLDGSVGTIDGGPGGDVFDYSRFNAPINFDLTTGEATGASGGVSNVEKAIPPLFQPSVINPPEADPPSLSEAIQQAVEASRRHTGGTSAADDGSVSGP